MVHLLAISIFLLPIVTPSSDDFWDDMDIIDNYFLDPEYLPTLATISQDQQVEPTPDAPQHSPSSGEKEEKTRKRRSPSTANFFPKYVTLTPEEIEIIRQRSIINESSSNNLSLTVLDDKLLALGSMHEWNELKTYEVEKYPKYWAKVCVTFWDQPLDQAYRIACTISRSYAHNKRRYYKINRIKRYLDLLGCRCYTYLTNSKIPITTPETFLIHKGNENEFFIFGVNETVHQLSIRGFKDGIALTNPLDSERSTSSNAKFVGKRVTLGAIEIHLFYQAVIRNNSHPRNLSLQELINKLMKLEEIHEWPDLLKYDHVHYAKYWAKVCVLFWGKPLDTSHRQSCILSPSLGDFKIRKLFIQNKTKYLDLLYCKCYSYVSNMKTPVSSADTFLVHKSSANEFFIFNQQPTESCQYTLFIKDFKEGITLPSPDEFN